MMQRFSQRKSWWLEPIPRGSVRLQPSVLENDNSVVMGESLFDISSNSDMSLPCLGVEKSSRKSVWPLAIPSRVANKTHALTISWLWHILKCWPKWKATLQKKQQTHKKVWFAKSFGMIIRYGTWRKGKFGGGTEANLRVICTRNWKCWWQTD